MEEVGDAAARNGFTLEEITMKKRTGTADKPRRGAGK